MHPIKTRLRKSLWTLASLTLLTVACHRDAVIHARSAGSLGLRRYVGDGFSFDYPADATIRPGRNFSDAAVDLYFLGPDLTVRSDARNRTRAYSVYSFELVVFRNASATSAFEWANHRFAPASPDTTDTGCGDVPQLLQVQIAGIPGVQVNKIGCDGLGVDYYLTDGRLIVGFRTYESDDELLQPLQNPFYALVLSSFRWNRS